MVNLLKKLKSPNNSYYLYIIILLVVLSLTFYPPWVVMGVTQKSSTKRNKSFFNITKNLEFELDTLKRRMKTTDSLLNQNSIILKKQQDTIKHLKKQL